MNFWILTDTHLGHENIKEYCGRPDKFEYKILSNLMVIPKPFVLIHIGDVCFYRDEYWHEQFMYACEGKRWLVRGNHDRKSLSWYLEHGWDFVADELKLDIFGKQVLLTHKPIVGRDDFDINIHGHHHNNMHHPEDETNEKHKLVFIEHEYKPISLRWLVENN